MTATKPTQASVTPAAAAAPKPATVATPAAASATPTAPATAAPAAATQTASATAAPAPQAVEAEMSIEDMERKVQEELQEFQKEPGSSNLEETLGDIETISSETSPLDDLPPEEVDEDTIQSFEDISREEEKSASKSSDGSMTMTLDGATQLRLVYQHEGQEVVVQFVDQFLCITLADGTEFRIPVGKKKKQSRAA